MSIIRVKKDKGYFAASNMPFNDRLLSWEARGVMGYLLSKPDNWAVSFTDLVKQGPAGAHKIRRVLKELQERGYLKRTRSQDEAGKFTWTSTVYETPTISRLSIDGLSIDGKPRDIISTDSDNNKGGEVFREYEANIGPLTPMIADQLIELEEDYSKEYIVEAIRTAANNNVRKMVYIKKVLENHNNYQGRKGNARTFKEIY